MTEPNRVPLVDALNAYQGDNIWEDVVYPHPEYDEAKTGQLEHGEGNCVATVDGTVLRWDGSAETWKAE